jgi:hypothetical protein
MVTGKAGSAVFINHRVFHGNYPNRSDKNREMVAYAYRPGWCGPGEEKPSWDPEELARLPAHVRELFGDPNTHYGDESRGNRPPGMAREAPGTSPGRRELV